MVIPGIGDGHVEAHVEGPNGGLPDLTLSLLTISSLPGQIAPIEFVAFGGHGDVVHFDIPGIGFRVAIVQLI